MHQNYRGFLDCDVPIVLQLVDQAPDRQADELGISLQEGQVLIDLDRCEVVAETTEAAENVEATCFGLGLFRAEEAVEHGQDDVFEFGLGCEVD